MYCTLIIVKWGVELHCVISIEFFVLVNWLILCVICPASGISCQSWKSTVMMPRLGVTECTVHTLYAFTYTEACLLVHTYLH